MEKLTRNGQAILCTVHQPSSLLFQRFDRILLLAKGGKTGKSTPSTYTFIIFVLILFSLLWGHWARLRGSSRLLRSQRRPWVPSR
jgi:hypothetical protein